MVSSSKSPAVSTSMTAPLMNWNASTWHSPKSVLKRVSPWIASPLYDDPGSLKICSAVVPLPLFQPKNRPSSVAQMKLAFTEFASGNDVPLLKTMPVGAPGTETSRPSFVPSPVYNVDEFEPLFETHHGLVPLAAMPQEFWSRGSGSPTVLASASFDLRIVT